MHLLANNNVSLFYLILIPIYYNCYISTADFKLATLRSKSNMLDISTMSFWR